MWRLIMIYYVLCCDENEKPLEIQTNDKVWSRFYLMNKPKFGDCYMFYGRYFVVEEILEDYSKVFMREEKLHGENKENEGSMPVFA